MTFPKCHGSLIPELGLESSLSVFLSTVPLCVHVPHAQGPVVFKVGLAPFPEIPAFTGVGMFLIGPRDLLQFS